MPVSPSRICLVLLHMLGYLFSLPVAVAGHVLVVADISNHSHKRLIKSIRDTLVTFPYLDIHIDVIEPDGLTTTLSSSATLPRLLITVGTEAALATSELTQPLLSVLHTLLPRTTYSLRKKGSRQ